MKSDSIGVKTGFFVLIFAFLFQQVYAQSTLDSALMAELIEMAIPDQLAASNSQAPPELAYLSQEEWEAKKDSIFRANQKRAEEILEEVGYPGIDRVGPSGESNFWVIAQHADFDPDFQKSVLALMEPEVKKGNASPRNYAYLTDRLRKNTGEKQLYGTQVDYNFITGEAFPLATEDPENLNSRRAEVGLEPIEDYLADMTASHMERNSSIGGITDAALILFSILMLILVVMMYFFTRGEKSEKANL